MSFLDFIDVTPLMVLSISIYLLTLELNHSIFHTFDHILKNSLWQS
jgi:hypothetical protein